MHRKNDATLSDVQNSCTSLQASPSCSEIPQRCNKRESPSFALSPIATIRRPGLLLLLAMYAQGWEPISPAELGACVHEAAPRSIG